MVISGLRTRLIRDSFLTVISAISATSHSLHPSSLILYYSFFNFSCHSIIFVSSLSKVNHSILPLPSFPTFHFVYQPLSILLSKALLGFPTKQHTFFRVLTSSDIFQFSSHIFVSKPLYYPIAHRSYISFHFIHQPFAISSFTCITFYFIRQK